MITDVILTKKWPTVRLTAISLNPLSYHNSYTLTHTWITSRSTQFTPLHYELYYPPATRYEWSSAAVIHNLLVSLPTRLLARCSGPTHQILVCP